MSGKKVIIVGAGIAGITAAVELAKNKFTPIVLESRKFAGGRAYSHPDSSTGVSIDNGQHLLMGAYHNFLKLLNDLGTNDKLIRTNGIKIPFFHKDKGQSLFKTDTLPGKFGMLFGLFNYGFLSFSEKINAISFILSLAISKKNSKDLTVNELLKRYKQTKNSIECFWEPLCLATMNSTPEKVSADIFRTVILKAFFTNSSNSNLIYPKTGLSELFVTWEDIIKKAGGTVRYGVKIEEIVCENNNVKYIKSNTEDFFADDYIFAIPPNKLLTIIDKSNLSKYFPNLDKFKFSPIISIYLWFNKDFADMRINGILKTYIQWIFNRKMIVENCEKLNQYPGHYAITISGADELVNKTKDELLEICIRELNDTFPQSRNATLLNSVIVKEKYATVILEPQIIKFRPKAETIIPNMYLAGDWTDTGLPATLEGASLSGYNAVTAIIKKHN